MNRDGFVNKKEFQWMTTNTILSQKKIDTMFKVFKYDNLYHEILPKLISKVVWHQLLFRLVNKWRKLLYSIAGALVVITV